MYAPFPIQNQCLFLRLVCFHCSIVEKFSTNQVSIFYTMLSFFSLMCYYSLIDDMIHPNYLMVSILKHLELLQRLYGFVVRHFLACVSQPAVGAETCVEIDIAGEQFSSSGRAIIFVSASLLFLTIDWPYVEYLFLNKSFVLVFHGEERGIHLIQMID